MTIYNVQHHKRYRFRLINAASNVCPFQLQIENHEFSVIASDGSGFEPVVADTLYFISGERYDFVVHANQPKVRDYWIRIRALPPCTKEIEEFALLRYHDGPVGIDVRNFNFNDRKPPGWLETFPDGRYFNTAKPNINGTAISTAVSYVKNKRVTEAEPDYSFKLFIATPELDNEVLFTSNDSIKFMGEGTFGLNDSQSCLETFHFPHSYISEGEPQQRWILQQHQSDLAALLSPLTTRRNRRENFLRLQ